jgi:DNA-binding CsgD family transcriptional regulator
MVVDVIDVDLNHLKVPKESSPTTTCAGVTGPRPLHSCGERRNHVWDWRNYWRYDDQNMEASDGDRSGSKRKLTERELEIVRLIAEDLSNRKIVEALGVSLKTIDFHKANIYKKLGVVGNAGVVRYAIRARIISA